MKTITQYFEDAKEPLRTILFDNFNRKENAKQNVSSLAEAITTGINWGTSSHNTLFSKLYDLYSEENIYKYLENFEEYFAYSARVINKKGTEYYELPPNGHTVTFSNNTFQNCQNFTIGNFQGLLQNTPAEQFKFVIKYFRDKSGGKRLLVIDVNTNYTLKIRKLFTNIVAETPYLSTNGSNMVMFIINVTEF